MSQKIQQNWAEGVSVIIPTFQRPEAIETALSSIMRQTVKERAVEIIVADNDPAGSARTAVQSLSEKSPFEIIYIHVPTPGVSNARNGAMAKVRGRFIAFLDDDMEALDGWIEALIATSLKFKAGLVFSQVIARMPNPKDPRNPYMAPFFSRLAKGRDEGLTSETFGTGGSLLDLILCDLPSPPFDTAFNQTGGEDDMLFEHLRDTGTKIAWSPQGKAYEHVPANRATTEYVWTRNFAFGQAPTSLHAVRGLRGLPGVVRYMTTGSIQILLYGPTCAVLKLLGHPAYIGYLARLARGVGKIFWFDRFSPKLYGTAVLKTPDTQPAE